MGTFDPTPNDLGIAAGANTFTLIGAVALIVGMVAYAAVEWTQTRRLDSIARQFSTRAVVLMALAIPINIVLGEVVGSALRLPLYLDSIGTILVGVLAGPMAGATTGLLSNLTWTFVLGGTPLGSPFAWPFGIVAAEVGFVAGVVAWAGGFRSRPGTPPQKLVAGVVAGAAVLAALVAYGILPFYRDLCATLGAQDRARWNRASTSPSAAGESAPRTMNTIRYSIGLVDRVGEQRLLEDRASESRAGLLERGDEQVRAGAGDAAEDERRDRCRDERGDDAAGRAGDERR